MSYIRPTEAKQEWQSPYTRLAELMWILKLEAIIIYSCKEKPNSCQVVEEIFQLPHGFEIVDLEFALQTLPLLIAYFFLLLLHPVFL